VQRLLAADEYLPAQEATRRVRAEQAARRLYQLRRALHASDQAPAGPGALADRRVRAAERRAQAALTRAGFSAPSVAADVLRQVQVLARTACLARLDYSTAQPARDAIASLITARPAPSLRWHQRGDTPHSELSAFRPYAARPKRGPTAGGM
jgi:hypothetical protein